MKCVILGLLGLQNGVMPDLRDMTQLKRKREVEEETEKSESSLEEECKRFRSQYVSPQVALFGKLFYLCLFCRLHLHRPTSPQSKYTLTGLPVRDVGKMGARAAYQPGN